jgi:hypothetical protein
VHAILLPVGGKAALRNSVTAHEWGVTPKADDKSSSGVVEMST